MAPSGRISTSSGRRIPPAAKLSTEPSTEAAPISICGRTTGISFCEERSKFSPLPPGEGARSAGEGKNGVELQIGPHPARKNHARHPLPPGEGLLAFREWEA